MFDLFGWFRKKSPSNNDNIDIPERPADYDEEEDEEEEFDEEGWHMDVELIDYDHLAVDEDGETVYCEICFGEMKYLDEGTYECSECGHPMDRARYFEYIGSADARPGCYNCLMNYPLCKRDWCHVWEDSEDPNDSLWPPI